MLSLRLPCIPLLRWLYMYFILGEIRDGKAGFPWCTLPAFYEYLILLKAEEIKTENFTVNGQIIIEAEQAIDVTSDCC